MCRASLSTPAQGSQRWINDGVNVTSQHVGVGARQPFPALNEFDRSGAAAWQRAQLGDRAPVRVTITRSPRSTRSSTSPPLLRRSRTLFVSTSDFTGRFPRAGHAWPRLVGSVELPSAPPSHGGSLPYAGVKRRSPLASACSLPSPRSMGVLLAVWKIKLSRAGRRTSYFG